jgi:hypothetical protein
MNFNAPPPPPPPPPPRELFPTGPACRDCAALRKALQRRTWESDQWRGKYLDLLERVHRLGEVQRGVEEVRHG